jgi:hypothetical protein
VGPLRSLQWPGDRLDQLLIRCLQAAHNAGYGRVVVVSDTPQPVDVHRLVALSGGVDLCGNGSRVVLDVDGFFAAEP